MSGMRTGPLSTSPGSPLQGALNLADDEPGSGHRQASDDPCCPCSSARIAVANHVAEIPQDSSSERSDGVGPFARECVLGSDQIGDGRLREPFCVAPSQEVAWCRPGCRDEMGYSSSGLVDNATTRERTASPDRQLRLLGAKGPGPDPSDPGREPAGLLENVSSERHVRPDRVPDLAAPPRQATIRAADHPVELIGPPSGSRCCPRGHDVAAHAQHVRIAVGVRQPPKPAGIRRGIVIEERHYVALGGLHPGVARPGESLRVHVLDDDHAFERLSRAREQLRIVVDDQGNLEGGPILMLNGFDRPHDLRPAIQGVRADDRRGPGSVVRRP